MRLTSLIVFGTLLHLVGCNPAFAERAGSQHLTEEREGLQKLAEIMNGFESEFAEFKTEVDRLRSRFERGRLERVPEITAIAEDHLARARSKWTTLNRRFNEMQARDLDLNRQIHRGFLDLNPALQAFIRMRINNRYGNGSPFPFLYRTWLGLSIGVKREAIPSQLRTREDIGGLEVQHGDDVLLHLTSGGIIRGSVEGWNRGGDLFIREVMPIGLVMYQKRFGHFRQISSEDWNEIGAVEIHRIAKDAPSDHTLLPFLDRLGNYSTYRNKGNFELAKIVHLKPSNSDLLAAAKAGRDKLQELRKSTVQEITDVGTRTRPLFVDLLIFDCESTLFL